MTLHFKYHELFARWHTFSVKTMDKGFHKQLNAADAVLMEFADKAENINIQNHFLDAQREIWLKADDMALNFHRLLEKQLEKPPENKPSGPAFSDQAPLDLLNLDIYEKDLALKTLAEKAEIVNAQALHALCQRLTVIYGGIPVDPKQIQGSPDQICTVFSQVVDRLKLENDALMVLYTLFDKCVLSLLPEIYATINQQLIEAGILPTLKYHIRMAADLGIPPKAEQQPELSTPGTSTSQTQSASELGSETLVRIKDLLAANRTKTHPRKPLPAGVKAATDQEVINTVSTIPHNRETAIPAEVGIGQPVDQLKIDRELLDRIQGALFKQRNKVKQQIGNDRLNDEQEDVIDVVGMLFEQMLDDDALPGVIKALLGHLHTPYIRIGLEDKDFFSNKDHPAREFLNQAIAASSVLIDEKDLDQGAFPLLKNIVHQIVRFRRQKQSDFIEFQDQLSKEVDRLSAKSKLLENRSQESEKGKAHLIRAREMALLATQKIFVGEKITSECKDFIDEIWVDFLTLVLLRNHAQQDSAEWQASQELAMQLLNISQQTARGQADAISIDQLSSSLLEQIGGLLPHHIKSVENFVRALSSAQQPTAILEITASAEETPPVDQAEIELQQELRELPANTWFQFDLDKDKPTRAKLSWYNSYSDRLLFVDQAGKKIGLKSVVSLATEIQRGNCIYFLEPKHSFWETAMTTIKKLLDRSTTN